METHRRVAAPDGTEIAWDSTGSGDPVVLVHGITESSRTFDPITRRLAETHEVITLDLRGHGSSGAADRYDLEAMAGDVLAVIGAAGVEEPHLIGHSLGGAVVSAVGAIANVHSIVDIDQSLRLAEFKAALTPAEPMLRDPDAYHPVIADMFDSMAGDRLHPDERRRIEAIRRADQKVILGVWDILLRQSTEEIEAIVEAALGGYSGRSTPYLALFGIDPGPDYLDWLRTFVAGASVELWADHGHYPHLVDPDRFVDTVRRFWSNG